jgi:hypothetical protein
MKATRIWPSAAFLFCVAVAFCARGRSKPLSPLGCAQVVVDATGKPTGTFAALPNDIRSYLLARFPDPYGLGMAGIAERDQPFNSTDVVEHNQPTRRFLLSGRHGNAFFLAYEHGGIAYHQHLVVFQAHSGRFEPCFAALLSRRLANYPENNATSLLEDLRSQLRAGGVVNLLHEPSREHF